MCISGRWTYLLVTRDGEEEVSELSERLLSGAIGGSRNVVLHTLNRFH